VAESARETIGDWLRVARKGQDAYEASLEDHFGAAQGADLLARCALAALDANGGGRLSSLHADWLATPPPSVPIGLRVERLATQPVRLQITATNGQPLGRVVASFGAGGSTLSYQDARLPDGLPDPDSLPTTVEYARKEGWPEEYAGGPVEFRRVGPLRPNRSAGESSAHVEWLKLRRPLPRDEQCELAALVFLAAFYDHWEFERRIGERFDYAGFEVLAQTVWLHGAARPEGWLLLRASSDAASEGRALARRELFARDGTLLASVASDARVAER
jgi:acyl-CoA thioesterase-2